MYREFYINDVTLSYSDTHKEHETARKWMYFEVSK